MNTTQLIEFYTLVDKLSKEKKMSAEAILFQAFRLYQMNHVLGKDGWEIGWFKDGKQFNLRNEF